MNKSQWAPRAINQPEPGCFEMRLVRLGPFVAARICRDSAGWHAVIDGQHYASAEDPAAAPRVFDVWTAGRVITEAEYLQRLRRKADAIAADPNHPAAHPTRPINLLHHDLY
jgi:hypothetical protein